ncbi:MAG TPA: response regulator [Anaeromyxobacteraceae bacterium]|nr:response regulator [Anaeromyxobacteraceae bacterium]
MSRERRAHPRFPLVLAVQYLGAESALDYTENLSASGLFLRTERQFKLGEKVKLVLFFPQVVEPLEIEVEVVRLRSEESEGAAGVAVRVPDANLVDRERLSELARRIVATGSQPEPSARILLVEDNHLVASMYAAALRRLAETDHLAGLGIEIVSDGAQAFERLLREPKVDVLVTDLFMPVLSGIELIEKVRNEPSIAAVPILVITSGADREREQLNRFGVAAMLRKPVKYHELVAQVRSILVKSGVIRSRCAERGGPEGERSLEPLTEASGARRVDPNDEPASRR